MSGFRRLHQALLAQDYTELAQAVGLSYDCASLGSQGEDGSEPKVTCRNVMGDGSVDQPDTRV